MRKIFFVAVPILALIGLVVSVTGRGGRAPVYAAENERTTVLISFGLDGVKDSDWSGTIGSPACTYWPRLTCRMPVRPAKGARIVFLSITA